MTGSEPSQHSLAARRNVYPGVSKVSREEPLNGRMWPVLVFFSSPLGVTSGADSFLYSKRESCGKPPNTHSQRPFAGRETSG
jgi:hypothetical protein